MVWTTQFKEPKTNKGSFSGPRTHWDNMQGCIEGMMICDAFLFLWKNNKLKTNNAEEDNFISVWQEIVFWWTSQNRHKKPCNSLATFLPRIVLVFNVTHTCVKAWFRWAAKPKLLTMLCSLFNSIFQRLLCSTVVIVSTVSTCVFYCSYCDGLSSKTHCQCLQHYWLVPSSYSLKVIYIKHVLRCYSVTVTVLQHVLQLQGRV